MDDMPVIFECRWVDAEICAGLTPELAAGSLYEALNDKLCIPIAYAEQRVRAVIPESRERVLLGVPVSQACLRIEGGGYLADGRPIWQESTLFRGDRYEIHGVLSPSGKPFGQLI